jgi:inosine-uridine nucleoside N-ribohydrolase
MRTVRSLRLVVAAVLLVAACSSTTDESDRTPVIVDYSPTVSDVGALLYLLSNPGVEVLAVTLPVTGEAGCELGVEVTLGILAMFDRGDIPVACDPDRPPGAGEWPEAFIGGNDALALALPDAIGDLDPRPAHQVIADVAADSDRPVVLYAVAPLTNVARALDTHPQLIEDLEKIVIMGGAVDVAGNVAGTGAEWNLWIDVPAAAHVIGSDIPVTLVPLDATNDVPTPGFWDLDLQEAEQSEAVRYLGSMVRAFPATTSGFFYLWDELAAAVAAGEELVEVEQVPLVVIEEPGPQFGSTVRDSSGHMVSVATAVPDPDGFYEHFLTTLAGVPTTARGSLELDAGEVPSAIQTDSPPEEVLAFWLVAALSGATDAAGSVVAADAPWPGLGNSPDAFVSGSAPYEASDTELACTAAGQVALCSATWTDLWIAAIADFDRGWMRARAVIEDGTIVEFLELSFSPEVTTAFDEHFTWLERAYPSRLAEACGLDGASAECSQLLIDTAEEWVANR